MKKLIKCIVITILVIGAIVGTSWIFYSGITKERSSYSNAVNFQYSSVRSEIGALLATANSAECGNGRFNELSATFENLDDLTIILTPYLSQAEGTDVDENAIIESLEDVRSMQYSVKRMLNEYVQKSKQVQTFNKETGANPVYKQVSRYLVEYARYLKKVNTEIGEIVDLESEMKFYSIELYLNVTINTFENLNKEVVVKVTNNKNINTANACFGFETSHVGNYSSNATLFIKNYDKCNAKELAENFEVLYNDATSLNDDVNNNTIYYLRKALGV
jgi:hypothetical protein